jgi:hypothetical protein
MEGDRVIELDRIVEALGLGEHRELLCQEWLASQETLPAGGVPFLEAGTVADSCRTVSLPDEALAPVQDAARRLDGDAPLQALVWHMHRALFAVENRPDASPWARLEERLGETAPSLYLLIAMSGLSRAKALHDALGIPGEVRRDTYQDIALWAKEHHQERGVWGIRAGLLGWFMNHLWGELYRIGRLQYMLRPFPGQLLAFRRRETGEVVALAEDGLSFRRDGQRNGTGNVFEEKPWVSRLVVDERGARGNPISPKGHAVNTEVFLPAGEWEQRLARGDTVLDMHIPAAEPMAYDACGESMRAAPAFFRTYFPETPFKAFSCTSWLLDSQLPDLLPPSSNLVRFMQELYLWPRLGDGMQTFERVFGGMPEDLTKASRDTTLRRAILDHAAAGGHMRSGGMFLLTEDLDWGRQVYLRGTRAFG